MRLRWQPNRAPCRQGHIPAVGAAREPSLKSRESHHDSVGMMMRRRFFTGRIEVLEYAHIVIFPKGAIKLRVGRRRIGVVHLPKVLPGQQVADTSLRRHS